MPTFFGVQIALDIPPGHPARRGLAEAVRALRAAADPAAQRPAWTRAAELLGAAIGAAALGTWDLVRDRGAAEYEEWASGLEEMADWPPEAFGAGDSLLLASLIFLVAEGSNADRTLGDLCDIPEPAWHRPATYARLVAAPPRLNFTGVRGSGLYLAPHPDRPGFAESVLLGDGFSYLQRIR